MRHKNLFILSIFMLIFIGCEKKEYVDVAPQLKINVIDEIGNKVEDATVKLYETEQDWLDSTNVIRTKTTNNDGVVLFKNLEEKIYYFFVSKDNLNNKMTIATHENTLKKNECRTFNVIVK